MNSAGDFRSSTLTLSGTGEFIGTGNVSAIGSPLYMFKSINCANCC